MEKYHNDMNNSNKRIERNKSLYEGGEQFYTNISGILETNNNKVDIEKLKETIKQYEEQNNSKKKLVKKEVDLIIEEEKILEDQESRKDINELINDALREHDNDEIDKYRTLKKEEYAILMKIKNKKQEFNKKAVDCEIKEELMNTMQLTSEEVDELESGLDIFAELETDNKDESRKSILEIIDEAKKSEEEFDKTEDLDGCFNTASLKITKEDFEDVEDVLTDKKVAISKKSIYLLLLLFIIIIILSIIYFLI